MSAGDRAKLLGLMVLFGVLVVLGIPVVAYLWENLNHVLDGDLGFRRIGSVLGSLVVFAGLVVGTGKVLHRLEPGEAR